jgi:predicted MFS family arabinose efflux permease
VLAGGLFSQYTTWRWAFWINLPVGALALIVPIMVLPAKHVQGNMREKLLRVDYAGSLLTIASSILVLVRETDRMPSRDTDSHRRLG